MICGRRGPPHPIGALTRVTEKLARFRRNGQTLRPFPIAPCGSPVNQHYTGLKVMDEFSLSSTFVIISMGTLTKQLHMNRREERNSHRISASFICDELDLRTNK